MTFNRIFTGAVLAALASAPALAGTALSSDNYVRNSFSVSYADLDLGSEEGRQTLDHRLDGAVRSVCGASDFHDIKETRDMVRCRNAARKDADAVREVALARFKASAKVAVAGK